MERRLWIKLCTSPPSPHLLPTHNAAAMADLFESYASDFASLTESIRSKLQSAKDEQGEVRKASLRRAQMEADEADEVLGQMDIELQSFPQSIKTRYSLKVREAKTDLEKLKKELVSDESNLMGRRALQRG